jgi:membrane protease YdiL (CAAX protease family)
MPLDDKSAPNAPITSALWLYFAFLATSAAGIIAIAAAAPFVPTEFVLSATITLVVAVWTLAGPAEVRPGLVRWPHYKWFAAAAGASLITFAAASAALALLKTLLGIPQIQFTPPFTAAGFGPAIVILLVAVQPAIVEEIAFRGVILGGLRHVLSPVEAIVVSAAMFMIIHLSVPSFPHLFLMGLALAWLRVQSGSLYPGMLLHFLHNLYCVLWEYAGPLHS